MCRAAGATVFGIAASLLASPAGAEDPKLVPGVVCRAAGQTDQDDLNYSEFGVQNEAGGSRSVDCPLVADHPTNTDGTDYVDVFVNITSGSMSCTLRVLDATGNVQASSGASSSGTGARTISLDLDESPVNGFYYLSCSMPAGSRVTGILFGEWT